MNKDEAKQKISELVERFGEQLIAFYERLGYIKTGEFKDFPENSALWQPKVEGLNLQYLAKLIVR